MSAKQSNGRNRISIKQITVYARLVSVCLIVGYLENLLSIGFFIALPGVKLGLSNAVALTLVCFGDKKGAWAVNITRICLSALLFGSLVSFAFSLAGGIASLAAVCLVSRCSNVSEIGISILGATVHNIFQCITAAFIMGVSIIYYLPVLLLCGALCGALCGILVKLIFKKVKTNGIF